MELGKWYKLKESRVSEFVEDNPRSNTPMVNLLNSNGGVFCPTKIGLFNEVYFIEEALCINGKKLTCLENDDEYFEICDDEFKFFEEVCEVTILPFKNYGVVNSENAEEIIRLIAKDFLNKEVKLC